MRRKIVAGAASLALTCFTACTKTEGPPPADGCKASNGVCRVHIDVATGTCTGNACVTLAPDSVHVGDGTGTVKDVNLLWMLPQGYAFCDTDGVAFDGGAQGQFSDNYPTDDSNGRRDTANGKKKNYHWKDANSAKGGPYKYKVTFHDDTCKTAYEKDPDVVNDM
jgi:hypothetical protein